MNEEALFSGVGVALVSIFDDAGHLLVQETAAHARTLAERGVRAVLVAGTTGEPWALSDGEVCALTHATREALPFDVPVIAGVRSSPASTAASLSKAVRDAGADAALVLPPRGVEDPVEFYREIADTVPGFSLLAYHIPILSPPGIPIERLSSLPIRGLKDSSGDPERLLAELDVFKGELYTGSSAVLSFAGPLGCTGALVALANVEPERCADAFAGDGQAQRSLTALHQASLAEFPMGLKQLVHDAFGTPLGLGKS